MAVFDVEYVVAGTDGSALGLVCPEIHFPYPGLDNRAGTHRARFQSDIHIAVGKPEVAYLAAGLIDGQDFRMADGVASCEPQIVCAYKDLSVLNDNTADRALFLIECLLGFFDSFEHKTLINIPGF